MPVRFSMHQFTPDSLKKMKVLNWVSWRFLNVPSCIAVLPDESVVNGHVNSKYDVEETQALLEHGGHLVIDIDVLEEWKDGILSIGTFAISPLECNTVENHEIIEEVDNTNDCNHNVVYDNNMEENPLMNVEFFSHELETKVCSTKEIKIVDEESTQDEIVLEDGEDVANKDECESIKKRVTLADLLLADSDHELVKELGDKLHHQEYVIKDKIAVSAKPCVKMMKPTAGTKKGLSKAKKLLKEDLHPIKKINQLIKRMMKKKIHPDIEGKAMQADMEMQLRNGIADNPTHEEVGSQLPPIQGATAFV